jgi:hypothetical protein
MVLSAAIAVYSRAKRSAISLNAKIDRDQLPMQLLQRIAEDIDSIIGPVENPQKDISVSIKNKLDEGYQSSQLIITRKYYNEKNQKDIFDQIVWQTNFDYDANSLILYRSHSGLTVEDKLFDENRKDWNKELYIPVTKGLTLFRIEAFKKKDFVDTWTEDNLPKAIRVTLSFTQPFRDIEGKLEVDDYDKQVRTIALNRGRNYSFKFVPPDYSELFPEPNDINEPNIPDDSNAVPGFERPDTNTGLDELEKFMKITND